MKIIIISVIFILWVISLIIFFSLALFYKNSHISFYKLRNETVELFKKEIDKDLEPINNVELPFELEKGENVYSIEYNLNYIKTLVNKKNRKIENETLNNDFFILKDAFKINPSLVFEDYKCLYITNNRIIIENDTEYIVIPFSKIIKLLYSLAKNKIDWFLCLSINTDKHYYKILVKNNDTINVLRMIYGAYLNDKTNINN